MTGHNRRQSIFEAGARSGLGMRIQTGTGMRIPTGMGIHIGTRIQTGKRIKNRKYTVITLDIGAGVEIQYLELILSDHVDRDNLWRLSTFMFLNSKIC